MFITVSTFASTGGGGYTTPIQLDYGKMTSLSVQTVVVTSGAGGLNYNVEYSLDALTTSASVGMTWFSTGSSNLSTNSFVVPPTPIRSLRINMTAGTSNMALTGTVLESFI